MPLRGSSPSSSGGDNGMVAPRPGVADPDGADDDAGEDDEDERAISFSLK
jgi:hypothetical protein